MRARGGGVLADGMAAGLLGYAAVVIVVALLNVLAGRSPFYTPALFGSALFYGLEDPALLVIAPGPVLAYNMVHLLVLLALGLLGAWLLTLAERHPLTQYLVLVLLVFVAGHVYAALVLFAEPLLGAAGWWHIGVGGLAAAVAMGTHLLRRHPRLRRELREIPMGAAPGSE